MPKKQKVAVLGGGLGSLVSAYELTRTPELRERYEVTVYQLGWRLGGKGASGRNRVQGRIEEHGLHIWFGFYENAFRVMREAYAELGRPADAPLAGWRDAFKPCDSIVLYEHHAERWRGWSFSAPRNPLLPGDPPPASPALPHFWEMADEMLSYLLGSWGAIRARKPALAAKLSGPLSFLPLGLDRLADELLGSLLRLCSCDPERAIVHALGLTRRRRQDGVGGAEEQAHRALLCKALLDFKRWLWRFVVEPNLEDDELRMFFTMFDVGSSTFVGIIEDGLIERGFDVVNGEDLRAWLARHGAQQLTLSEGPLLRAVYDTAFAYEGGDIARPTMAAGTAVHDVLRLLFSYRGAFAWKMQAGMGDTVVTPLYEVLRSRGVRFEFFHWVQRLRLSADRRSVAAIEVIPQVRLNVPEYDPLVSVKDLPCWPSEPDWKQIADAKKLRGNGVDLEGEANPLEYAPRVLRKGKEFDLAVLGISVGALAPICTELCDDPGNPRFAEMIRRSRTVMTQAFQLWLRHPAERLGWAFAEDSATTSFVEPLDTSANMPQLVKRERWGRAAHVEDVAYFCGVLKDVPGETQALADARVRAEAIAFLRRDVRAMWPRSTTARGGFDWAELVDVRRGAVGVDRFDSQFWRANFQPTERYVLTPPGSVASRLKADQSGYENLFLAGDWIKTGLDAGCVEAAVMSGMQASRAICGSPAVVVGEDADWLAGPGGAGPPAYPPAPLPRYVEYGGLATCPSPVKCLDASMYAFFLQGNARQLARLCERVFEEPSGGAVVVRPLGASVMLTFGSVAKIEPQLEPWSKMGFAGERQVALWIPVAVVRGATALQIGWFVPYMWVDNPLSLCGGREIYGYQKNLGWIDLPDPKRPAAMSLQAYGGDYGPANPAGPHPLIEVAAVRGRGVRAMATGAPRWDSVASALAHARTALGEPASEANGGAGGHVKLPNRVFDEVLESGGPAQFCLRQFRAVSDGRCAGGQQITAAATTIQRVSGRPLLSRFQFTLHPLDSHPIAAELGLRSQRTAAAFEVQMDFTLEDGSLLWDCQP